MFYDIEELSNNWVICNNLKYISEITVLVLQKL